LASSDERKFEKAHLEWNEQQYLFMSGRAAQDLSYIFKRLPHLEHLSIAPDLDRRLLWPDGHFKAVEHIGLDTNWQDHHACLTTVWIATTHALADSGLELKVLHVDGFMPKQGITMLTPPVLASLSSALACLKKLAIAVKVFTTLRLWHRPFAAFLDSCSNISNLELSFGVEEDESVERPYQKDPDLDSLETWLTFPQLDCLRLNTVETRATHLVEFLERYQETLRHLVVYIPWLGLGAEQWRLVLGSLALNFRFDHIEFSVYEIGDEKYLVQVEGSSVLPAIASALQNDVTEEMNLPPWAIEE
jgi:hypothetical protein